MIHDKKKIVKYALLFISGIFSREIGDAMI
jgi:hypothetical protein